MTPYHEADGLAIYCGDAIAVLRELPDAIADCVVTSPPFLGLRDYGTAKWVGGEATCEHGKREPGAASGNKGHVTSVPYGSRDVCWKCGARRVDGQIGLEGTPAEFVGRLVEVFDEVARVLKPHGSVLVEIGDSYASKARGNDVGWEKSTLTKPGTVQKRQRASLRKNVSRHRGKEAGLKEKDLMGVPWEFAFAMRDAGWWLRGEYIWHKPSAMPESTKDRCSVNHSRVFHFTTRKTYYWDWLAIAEPTVSLDETHSSYRPNSVRIAIEEGRKEYSAKNEASARSYPPLRNARSVWTITTEPRAQALCRVCRAYWERNAPDLHCGVEPIAHFAAMPVSLAEKAIKAATSEHGVCPDCGAPWERIIEEGELQLAANTWNAEGAQDQDEIAGPSSSLKHVRGYETIGWKQTCGCRADVPGSASAGDPPHDAPPDPVPALVLDPFGGSGTTLDAARRLGRHALMVDLNPDYCEIAARRLAIPAAIAQAAATAVDPVQLALG